MILMPDFLVVVVICLYMVEGYDDSPGKIGSENKQIIVNAEMIGRLPNNHNTGNLGKQELNIHRGSVLMKYYRNLQ